MPAPERMTGMEKQAIQDAKPYMLEALKQLGMLDRFNDWTPQQMEYLIWQLWIGVRSSMIHQSSAGEIPF